MPTAIAIAAHPDDIEFMMAGTLLQLKDKGWEIHYLNLSSGNCGSQQTGPEETARIRAEEAQEAAQILGATWHPPFSHDLEIFYDIHHLRKLAAILHEVAPDIVLTHSPEDYMEDHMNTCRLAVTAAFTHSMPNFRTDPPTEPPYREVALYHALPHSLKDQLRRKILPDLYIDITKQSETKHLALAAHRSQHQWLQASQGMNAYLQTQLDQDREVGRMSQAFEKAEAWRIHNPIGFHTQSEDPLSTVLQDCLQFHPQVDTLG
jgi:LmbE family N-acetylglucosaminyl deacetylase